MRQELSTKKAFEVRLKARYRLTKERGEHSKHALNSIPMQRIKEGEADRYHNKVPDLGLYDIFFQHSNVARAPCIQPHSASNVEF